MKIVVILLAVLLVMGLVFGGKLVSIRNNLVVERNNIEGAWAQTDVALQRRADLIPNLVETVKGFAKQEQTVPPHPAVMLSADRVGNRDRL